MSAPPPDELRNRPAQRMGEALFTLCLLPILVAALGVSLRTPFWASPIPLLITLGVATVGWWLAIALARQRCGDLRIVVFGAIGLRLIGLVGWPDLSGDVYRYVWEGRVVASGMSPYAFAPDAEELAPLRAELAELNASLNNSGLTAAYPPVTQMVTFAVASSAALLGDTNGAGAVGAARVLFAFCDLLVLWPLIVLLRRKRLPPSLAVVWGWCPLVTLEFAGSGHFDALGIVLLVGALALLTRGGQRSRHPRARAVTGIVLLAGATLVKVLPICALPFLIRGKGWWRRLAGFALLLGLAFVPLFFLRGGLGGVGAGVSAYAFRWESAPLVYHGVEWVFARVFDFDESLSDPRRLARGLVVLVWLVLALRLFVLRRGALEATTILIGSFLILTPTLHPWYVTWVLPFVALRLRASWLWLAGMAPLLYLPLTEFKKSGVWEHDREWLVIAPVFFVLWAYELRRDWQAGGGARGARRQMRMRRGR